ncbi:hypothetical protein [Methylobacterium sp. J-068]|uniref:hypothetical protein n=1 Tax=Methylobacterium sp. J-068 TaxID=2836649 RepID=UPI001FBA76F7|nr:hypothetical protein [Methylobacterium sp. J-068]MCJ2036305.1 hypothetical protein [Methylobacterium sp. J-068]
MPATDDRTHHYAAERDRLIRELEALDSQPHPEGRQFEDGFALRDTEASTMEGLRLRIQELTGLIEQIETGNA